MNITETYTVQCPYCSEVNTLSIDCTQEKQSYVEECEVCCQPILINVAIDSGENIDLLALRENE